MQNKIKLKGIGIALLTAISLTGCSENAQRPVPASPVVTISNQAESETSISDEESSSESKVDLSLPSSEESFTESNIKITDNFINALNSVIDSAADVEELNSGIKSADEDVLIASIQVFESSAAFKKNTILSAGKFENGMIVLVEFSDGKCYITKRGERTIEDTPAFMLIDIIERADSIEQLATEIDAYNLVLGDRKVTSITLYDNNDDAIDGSDSGKKIIENGKVAASDSVWRRGGFVRIAYESEEAWGIVLKEYK